MEDDDYGSDGWGDIDYHELIAAADEVELRATPSKPQPPQQKDQWNSSGTLFMDDDFDDLDEDDMLYAAVPSIAVPVSPAPSPRKRQVKEETFYQSLGSLSEILAPNEPVIKEKENAQPNDGRTIGLKKERGGSGIKKKLTDSRSKGVDDKKILPKVENGGDITADKGKRKTPDQDIDGDHPRKRVEYHGTIFPRFTKANEKDLADAVSVAEFSLRLMEILTSALREFLETNINSYPRQRRQEVAHNINKMVGHKKANDSFHGWDFLALANFVIYQRNLLPRSIQNPQDIIERLRVLKTTMRWTFAHTSLQEEERKHPIELSLWAINTLLLIENLGVPMEYASKVMTLHQRLWFPPPPLSPRVKAS